VPELKYLRKPVIKRKIIAKELMNGNFEVHGLGGSGNFFKVIEITFETNSFGTKINKFDPKMNPWKNDKVNESFRGGKYTDPASRSNIGCSGLIYHMTTCLADSNFFNKKFMTFKKDAMVTDNVLDDRGFYNVVVANLEAMNAPSQAGS
jgi:hypothetical protein